MSLSYNSNNNSYLEDLDDLAENSDEELEISIENKENEDNASDSDINKEDEDIKEKDNNLNLLSFSEIQRDGESLDSALYRLVEKKSSNSIGLLRKSIKYQQILSQIHQIQSSSTNIHQNNCSTCNNISHGLLENSNEYRLALSCNKLILEIDSDMASTQKLVAELYSKKFPELESLIPNKIDYIRVVQRIGNETDLTLVSLQDLLSPSLIMILSVAASTTLGQKLLEEDIREVYRGCEEILQLYEDKISLIEYVESCMFRIAPNLTILIGSRIAAQLIGLAGGIISLSKIPSCNIQVMGQEKKHSIGLSKISLLPHTGILFHCDLIQSCPHDLKKKVLKILSAKVALVARIDSYNNHPNGSEGKSFRHDLELKIQQLQEPDLARIKKALPIPLEKKKSKRGGKRVHKFKEKFAMTDLRIQQNRLSFRTDIGEYGDSAMGYDQGMIGLQDTGNVRAIQKKESKFLKKSKTSYHSNQLKVNMNNNSSNSSNNGLQSTLAFTPVQGIELVNPNAAAERVKEANKKWFNSQSGFLSAAPK